MTYIHFVKGLPQNQHISGHLSFSVFEQTCTIPFSTAKAILHSPDHNSEHKLLALPINKLRVFYFFASPPTYRKFLQDELSVTLHLRERAPLSSEASSPTSAPYSQSARVRKKRDLGALQGNMGISLRQLSNEMVYKCDYEKVFENQPHGTFVSMKITVGAVMGENIDTSLLLIKPWRGVFISEDNEFFSMEPLPKEWLDAIPDQNALRAASQA